MQHLTVINGMLTCVHVLVVDDNGVERTLQARLFSTSRCIMDEPSSS